MIDIEAMRREGRSKVERKPVKTFLSDEAIDRLSKAADYTGLYMYELIEKLILTQIPALTQIEGEAQK